MYRPISTENYKKYMEQYQIDSLLAKVICSFNYTDEEITSFFHPLEQYDFDTEVLEPIKQALLKIKREKKKVFVFGDYDCDGICATTIMVKLLRSLGIECGYYLPSRINEGYGLNMDRLVQAKDKGYDVLITVDNGVSCQNELRWAKENGMMTIVTDHHIITEEVEADYLLHPTLLSEDYHYLCGTGVVYILAVYLGFYQPALAILAMIATIADVMSLKGANVKIVNDGLAYLNDHQYRNVEMMDNFEYPIDEMDVSFKVVPKVNAVGRMSTKTISEVNQVVKYFLSDNPSEMNQLFYNVINALNDDRKKLSATEYQLCKQQCDPLDRINFVYIEDLHVGILGLIASRIADETNKITFIMTNKNDNIVGSVRSVNQIDVMEILNEIKDKTVNLGGHAYAAGITIEKSNLDFLKQFISEKCEHLSQESIMPVIEINEDELNYMAIKELFSYHPYGQDRKLPLMMITIPNESLKMMKTSTQLKWNVNGVDFISFKNEGYNYYQDKKEVTIVGKLQVNKFKGRLTYQVMVSEVI